MRKIRRHKKMRYKSIRVPEWAYCNLDIANHMLRHRGLEKVLKKIGSHFVACNVNKGNTIGLAIALLMDFYGEWKTPKKPKVKHRK